MYFLFIKNYFMHYFLLLFYLCVCLLKFVSCVLCIWICCLLCILLPFCYLNVLFRIFHSVFNFLLFALHCFVWIIFWFVSLSASLFVHIRLSTHWFSYFHICNIATIVLHPWPEGAKLKPTWWYKEDSRCEEDNSI